MRYDEFSFLNQQLAGMLRSGIPLEGALRQLCSNMRRGRLRHELEELERDLAQGTPIADALAKRRLPEFYRQMVQVGLSSNDLPGVLILVADYYQKLSFLWTRLKGLMVYPTVVLIASLGLSIFLAVFLRTMTLADLTDDVGGMTSTPVMVWSPLILLSVMTVFVLGCLTLPSMRRELRWRLPGFKEAGLSQIASAISLMLRGGTDLSTALGLAKSLEMNTPAGRDIALWQQRLAGGDTELARWSAESRVFPPVFFWLVQTGGENLAEGFQRASEMYHARALHRTEMLLYAALPVSVLFLGVVILTQTYPLVQALFKMGTVLDQF